MYSETFSIKSSSVDFLKNRTITIKNYTSSDVERLWVLDVSLIKFLNTHTAEPTRR